MLNSIGLNDLRKMFLQFYETKDHFARKSFTLVPEKDKSLLLINSGMAPLKPYFAGLEVPPSKRMCTCQKCIRTGDIENVGHTARHATFFEMLGNFSFGDYFKKEAISWAWEFVTKHLNLPEERVWVTIYENDEEAFDIWHDEIGIPKERIVRLGKEDNFWEIGTGPCGPCSELYFDRGEAYGCGKEDCKPGCDCDRYVEFWNLVFTQFNKDEYGQYTPLPHPNIDTGMGLERLACIMQQVDTIFEIDTIRYILDGVVEKAGVTYESSGKASDISVRVITDHIRSVVFLIGDGVLPSNEGRGYVMRRLLRRAARHGRLLGIQGAFLTDLADRVIEVSGGAYPELRERGEMIKKIIAIEEEKFNETLDQGTQILEGYINEMKEKGERTLSGQQAFKLYDTYGFPVELTEEILEESGCGIDREDFMQRMAHQKETARASRKELAESGWKEEQIEIFENIPPTVFVGYDELESKSNVTAIGKNQALTGEAIEGDEIALVLEETPFYTESGGQVSDTGLIIGDTFIFQVERMEKIKDIIIHHGKIQSGTVRLGDPVTAKVDVLRRNACCRNHSATHLLHEALSQVLGDHVQQAGSLVTPERLRFDFTHFEAMTKEELQKVEEMVNEKIGMFLNVRTEVTDIETAKTFGARALFGEKYGDMVRVVMMQDFSVEFCGGTHVSNTGQIGALRILSESGVAAGVRRIEAVTGYGLYESLVKDEETLEKLSGIVKANPSNLLQKTAALSEEYKNAKKELEHLRKEMASESAGNLLDQAKEIGGVKLVCARYQDVPIKELREISDGLKKGEKGYVLVFASVAGEKVTLMVSVSDDLLDKGYHAGSIIKEVAAVCGGGGGGKADMAQAGGKDPGKIDDAFKKAEEILQNLSNG